MINSYPTVFAIGHRAIEHLFEGPVLVEEKIDGSQFSFALLDGTRYAKSKKAVLYPQEPESGGMFNGALRTVNDLDLHEGWTYRSEYVMKPTHNVLRYDRCPPNWLILYDVETEPQTFLSYEDKAIEAERLGLMVVPRMHQGVVPDLEMFQGFLERSSCLGETKVEGVVVKNYNVWTTEKKVAIGKYVSEAFKETNAKAWKEHKAPVIDAIIASLRTEARWQKTVQHLRDAGELEHSPRDIGKLFKELQQDTIREEEDFIRDRLFQDARAKIVRGVAAGFAEWYKEQLLKSAFDSQEPQ